MVYDKKAVADRLKEIMNDSQEVIAKKLNMTQGNVSKLLSGAQQPTLDTLYRIATVYNVSIDWLMNLSDRKKCIKLESGTTYGLAVEAIQDLVQCGSEMIDKEKEGIVEISITGPILVKLIRKSRALSKADWELYKDWKNTRLSMFDDKAIVWSQAFRNHKVEFLVGEATTESNLLEVYEVAKNEEDEYAAMMQDNHSPFRD